MNMTRLTALVGVLLTVLLMTAASAQAASADRGAHAAGHRGAHAAAHRGDEAKRHRATKRARHARKRRAAVRATPAACQDTTTQPTAANVAAIRASVLCLVNRERAARGLVALTGDARLATAAQRHAADMAARGYFAHTTPDGVDFTARIRAAGYRDWSKVAENLAWGAGVKATPASIVQSWMDSPGHRANILDGTLRESGIGVVLAAPVAGVGGGVTYAHEFGLR